MGDEGKVGQMYDMRTIKQLTNFINQPTQVNWEKINFTHDSCYISDEANCCHNCPFLNSSNGVCLAIHGNLEIGKKLEIK